MRAAQSQQRRQPATVATACGRRSHSNGGSLRLSQRHAGGAASANVTPIARSKVPETRRMLTFGVFGTFWHGRVTSEQLSQVTRQNRDFSKSPQKLFGPMSTHVTKWSPTFWKKSGNLGMAFCAANNTSREFIFFLTFQNSTFFTTFEW
jgi:hypothetical protein